MPAVSVIIPVYNVEPYIARCVRSLFGQTLLDIEFIFVDDCSQDNSMEIMWQILTDEFPSRFPQVKTFRMPQNSGQAKVRMYGMSMATGDYVIHCDPDDDVLVDIYQKMYERAIADSLDIVVCDYYMVKNGHVIIQSQFAEPGGEVQSVLSGQTIGALWCRLFRRSVLDGIQAAVGNMTEDLVITVQGICNSCRIGYIREPLYYYFLRDNSISFASGRNSDLSRWRDSCANARLLVGLLVQQYGYKENESIIVYYKYKQRDYLKAYVHIPEYYKKWRDTFPEIDKLFLFTHGISAKEKLWFIMIHMHLYNPWKRASKAVRRLFFCMFNTF